MYKRMRGDPELFCEWDFDQMILFIFVFFCSSVSCDTEKPFCQVPTKERTPPEATRQYYTCERSLSIALRIQSSTFSGKCVPD